MQNRWFCEWKLKICSKLIKEAEKIQLKAVNLAHRDFSLEISFSLFPRNATCKKFFWFFYLKAKHARRWRKIFWSSCSDFENYWSRKRDDMWNEWSGWTKKKNFLNFYALFLLRRHFFWNWVKKISKKKFYRNFWAKKYLKKKL